MNVYIHIPFCKSKCAYCAFLSHCDFSKEDEYVKSLVKEIGSRSLLLKNQKVETIYFGGGTPSLLSTKNINIILNHLHDVSAFSKNCEITLECKPEDIIESNLITWKDCGINRLSVGIQSLDDAVRKTVGRNLIAKDALRRVKLAKKYIENIGVDLIAGLPSEVPESFLSNLASLAELNINHISLYDLEISQDSVIGKNIVDYNLLSEPKRAELLTKSWDILNLMGYEQYEISNFAKDKKYCKHNLDFWLGKDYVGFGLGAASKIGDQIIENTPNFKYYLKGNKDTVTKISSQERDLIEIACILRLNSALPSKIVQTHLETVKELILEGYLDKGYKVTKKGRLFNNYLLERFASNNLAC